MIALALAGVGGVLLCALGAWVLRPRRFVVLNPHYRDVLRQQGLHSAADFLALPAVIISGHPDRNVARVTLGEGAAAIPAFLKREHRIPWRDRLANAWAGLGFTSKSYREARMLAALRQAGIGCPDWIAAGEDGHGRAFLVVRELTGTMDLRVFLQSLPRACFHERRRFARLLGDTLAQVHRAGFNHPDLYSKHLLVDGLGEAVYFLDWQRSGRRHRLSAARRWHDLAALDATLAPELATRQERLACLRAYLQGTFASDIPRALLAESVRELARRAQRQLRKRHIREQRQPAVTSSDQSLVWLDGEALCVAREFQAALNGRLPDWLVLPRVPASPGDEVVRTRVVTPGERSALLVRRRTWQPFRRLWAWLLHRPLTSSEVRQAGLLFRLQRHGVGAPRLLAVGERHFSAGRLESFLLTEPVHGAVPLASWLASHARQPRQCRQVVRSAAVLLRRMHEAGCHFEARPSTSSMGCLLAVQCSQEGEPVAMLGSAEGIRVGRSRGQARALRDLRLLRDALSPVLGHRADEARFLLAYLGQRHWTPAARRMAARLGRADRPASSLVSGEAMP